MSEELVSALEVIEEANRELREGRRAAPLVTPTGFELLDRYLGGGLRAGELTLLGGPQGLGKTAWALQVARNVAAGNGAVVVLSFEHDTVTLIERLVAIEAGEALGLDGLPLRRVREALEGGNRHSTGSLADRLSGFGGGAEALERLHSYRDRLLLHRSAGSKTGLTTIRQAVRTAVDRTGQRPLVIVDYLQKVHVQGNAIEDERVAVVVAGLKDLALELEVPVMAIVAADTEGITPGQRLRVNHLRGSSALAYEADVVLIMNEKYDVVARHHLTYATSGAERFREYVVLTVEKNRSGLSRVDVQLRKRLDQSRFEREAEPITEELVDERLPG